MSAHTEAVEAAARAAFMRNRPTPPGLTADEFFESCKRSSPVAWEAFLCETERSITAYLRHMRAAGYVVTKVPEERRVGGTDWLRGRNAARAEMLANAVEVPYPIATPPGDAP